MTGFNIMAFVNAIIYAFLGIIIFSITFAVADRLTPHHLLNEILDGKNMPLAIVTGLVGLGICIIIAAAIH
ncbi:MAG: DUF350 domain-containing protein [Bryobacter sp.]|nr:DUF350 domain-containing protein [Bryobacter sp.]